MIFRGVVIGEVRRIISILRSGSLFYCESNYYICNKMILLSASPVQAALKPLLKNDLVTQDSDAYRVYDYFFRSGWLRVIKKLQELWIK